MNHVARCRVCGCGEPAGAAAHAVVVALVAGDLDHAIAAGLLDCPRCNACDAACTDALLGARDARITALAARERYRARNARMRQRATELARKRGAAPTDTDSRQQADAPTPIATRPSLPAAAAMALARAKAKAGERHKP